VDQTERGRREAVEGAGEAAIVRGDQSPTPFLSLSSQEIGRTLRRCGQKGRTCIFFSRGTMGVASLFKCLRLMAFIHKIRHC